MSIDLKSFIRDIPDFPKAGILFRDITPLLANYEAFDATIGLFAEEFRNRDVHKIVGMESRGFLFGAPLAQELGVGFIPVRKPGKLPAETIRESYQLEYGQDALEMHKDAISPNDRVLIIDDLLATGGTAAATGRLVQKLGGEIVGYAFTIELAALRGRELLQPHYIYSILRYED
jgi:adenine phosphoribosyltransferase